MNKRLRGPLDPLIEKMPNKRAIELARLVNVSRNTLLNWQKDPETMSDMHRLQLQLVCKSRGLKLDFLWKAASRPSDRYTCGNCEGKGHRKNYPELNKPGENRYSCHVQARLQIKSNEADLESMTITISDVKPQ